MKKANTSLRLKQLMEEKGLRQIDILNLTKPYCQKYGIKMNKSDISQYVSGKNEPSQDKLVILGMALNVSEAWLMGYDVSKERTDTSKIEAETYSIIEDIETLDTRVAYYTNFRTVLNILGYNLTTKWDESPDGESIDLLENKDFKIEIPHSIMKEKMNSTKSFIEFQIKELFEEYTPKPRNKQFDSMSNEELFAYLSEPELEAAHTRTDIQLTDEMKKHDDDIMNDDSEWE